jgi:nitronate monooxygenase
MGAPMAGAAGGSLAFQTCRAGGLGFIAAGHLINQKAFDKLEREIKIFKDISRSLSLSFPLAIGFIGFSTFGKDSPGWDYVRRILEEHKPKSIQIFAPAISQDLPGNLAQSSSLFTNNIDMCQSYGCQVIVQVGSVKDAITALDAGVDCLIAQGTEAGGHGIRKDQGNGTLSLTARLVRLAQKQKRRIPVLAAGGIVDGRGLIAALSLGADGAVLGTRLWASQEALGSSAYKNALVNAGSCDDVVRTRVFDTINNSHRQTKWPYPFDSSGTLRNEMTEAWDTSIPDLEAELKSSMIRNNDTRERADIVEELKRIIAL